MHASSRFTSPLIAPQYDLFCSSFANETSFVSFGVSLWSIEALHILPADERREGRETSASAHLHRSRQRARQQASYGFAFCCFLPLLSPPCGAPCGLQGRQKKRGKQQRQKADDQAACTLRRMRGVKSLPALCAGWQLERRGHSEEAEERKREERGRIALQAIESSLPFLRMHRAASYLSFSLPLHSFCDSASDLPCLSCVLLSHWRISARRACFASLRLPAPSLPFLPCTAELPARASTSPLHHVG